MTLEEIRQYIEKQLDDNETSCACGNRVSYGESCAYEKCLELLDKLDIFWHPFPAKKPKEKNGYMVSVVDESNGYCFTDVSFYHPNLGRFEMDDVYQLHVYAWAELPKPCKKDET